MEELPMVTVWVALAEKVPLLEEEVTPVAEGVVSTLPNTRKVPPLTLAVPSTSRAEAMPWLGPQEMRMPPETVKEPLESMPSTSPLVGTNTVV